MSSLQEIIEISNQMDDLNRVMLNCIGSKQSDIILKEWQELRKILMTKIDEFTPNNI